MNNVSVVTNYTNGTSIFLDANPAANFITGLAISVIIALRDTINEEDECKFEITKSNDQDIMDLLSEYCEGRADGRYCAILETNVKILFAFVRDVVENENVKGLYLLYHMKNTKNGKSTFDLVVKALQDAHQYYSRYEKYKNNKSLHYNRLNESFLKLVKGTAKNTLKEED